MKLSLTILFSCSVVLSSFSQVDKKLKKILGYEVIKLDPTDNYKWKPDGEIIFYDSKTIKGDTTGASNKGEFLMFRDDITSKRGEAFKLFRLDWVSNYDYEKFINWVRDSITLEMVYLNTDPTGNDAIDEYTIAKMLDHPEFYKDPQSGVDVQFDPSQRFINRELFNLSWKMPGIRNQQTVPLINDLYLRPDERFYRAKDWDERKFNYGEKGSDKEILISPDRDVWARESKYPFDLNYNLANYYSREEPSETFPVIGLLGTQIQAYLDHEEDELQKKFNKAEVPYTVKLSLPTEAEIKLADTADCDCKMTFLLESNDMTSQWQITNAEYWEFLSAVQDSILREQIYYNDDPSGRNAIEEEVISEMLKHDDVYYDEVNLSWQEFDPSQPFINRQLFSMDQDFNWKKKITPAQYIPLIQRFFEHPEKLDTIKGNIDHRDFKMKNYVYNYSWQDLARRSKDSELIWNEEKKIYEVEDAWEGKTLNLNSKSVSGFESGVRRHKDLSYFNINESVHLYPGANCRQCNENCGHEHGYDLKYEDQIKVCKKCIDGWDKDMKQYDFWSQPEALITAINYNQALAYYHWKYQRHTWTNKTNTRFHDDLVPTQEQFEKAQKGEAMVLAEQKVDFPNPWFRYVIHFYPKK